MSHTGKLISTYGVVTFDTNTGLVFVHDLDKDFGPPPVYVNIAEWKRRYPLEHGILAEEHDVLDFGYVDANGKYEPPCEAWRLEREDRLKKGEPDKWATDVT